MAVLLLHPLLHIHAQGQNAAALSAESRAEKFASIMIDIQTTDSTAALIDIRAKLLEKIQSIGTDLDRLVAELKEAKESLREIENKIRNCMLKDCAKPDVDELYKKKGEAEFAEAEVRQRLKSKRISAAILATTVPVILEAIKIRIAELTPTSVRGTWTATYQGEDNEEMGVAGTFLLQVTPGAGTVTGSYDQNGGGSFPVSGTWDPVTASCSGSGANPDVNFGWSGTLRFKNGVFSGAGELTFKDKTDKGRGGGTWSTQ